MKTKKASIFTKVVVSGLIIYAAVTLVSLKGRIETAEEQRQAIQDEITALGQENDEREYLLENSDDPDIIEDIARDELGLVMPGDKIFYGVNE